MADDVQRTVSPIDGSVYVERPRADAATAAGLAAAARAAQHDWVGVPLAERCRMVESFVANLLSEQEAVCEELTWQMGRPLSQAPGELRGLAERARFMASVADAGLAPVDPGPKDGFTRFIERVPLGVVLVVAPWNFPFMTAVNAVVPALLAGNTVVLKHSAQTPLVAERFAWALQRAGLPDGAFQVLHASHAVTTGLISQRLVDFVAFTGSVPGGVEMERAAAGGFLGLGLELGGKDPGYVRADADLAHTIDGLADGAFFNAGQSCCGIERIYVDRRIYGDFVEGFVAATRNLRLGDPREPDTTLGPMVRAAAAEFVRDQVREAVAQGARALIDPAGFPADRPGTPYLAPQVLVDVTHDMRVMREESFGPVVGIMAVDGDDEAIRLMNDSDFGLTASVWTKDVDTAIALGRRVETGTWFMNRCDYLDPALAWTGVKDSGRGCTLSVLGFHHLTRPKSFHLRVDTAQ